MTIEQRVERMFNPGGSTPTGVPVTAVAFASLPPAASVPGQIRTISDVGPAPGIELVSNGTIWRPRGGRQVLARRSINPVTVQALGAGAVAETIGPFPGGLVRAGMQIQFQSAIDVSGITSAQRYFRGSIGNTPPLGTGGDNVLSYFSSTTSGSSLVRRVFGTCDVRNDSTDNKNASYVAAYDVAGASASLLLDVSLPWYMQIHLTSAAETAVAISTATWVGGVATYNTSAASTLAVGDKTTIAGVDLAGYNGVFIVASVVDTDTFTVAMASDPGGSGTGGTSSRISNMISQSYVLELVG